jgi:AMP nucleosidase
MKEKSDIVRDWLPRYTGIELDAFGKYILLTNFSQYVESFAERFNVRVEGTGFPLQSATAENITIRHESRFIITIRKHKKNKKHHYHD